MNEPDIHDNARPVAAEPAGADPGTVEHLAQKTRMLEVLYDVATSISESSDLDDLLTRVLGMLMGVTRAGAGIAFVDEDGGGMRLVDSVGFDEERLRRMPVPTADSVMCASIERYREYLSPGALETDGDGNGPGLIVVPFQYHGNTLGCYNLLISNMERIAREDIQHLLTSVGRHLAVAIEQHKSNNEAKRMSIMRERTMIAHELHDSLAQTLASLRFHVRVLDEVIQQTGEYAAIRRLEEIENGLEQAYTELRELIAHFRAPVGAGGLVPALARYIQRFREESGISVFMQNEWGQTELPAGTEIQVLRIVQEALANIRKHSFAQTARVLLRNQAPGRYLVLIEDDGVGFDRQAVEGKPGEHIGLSVMAERAEHLGGTLRVDSEPQEGTRVELLFHYPPVSRADRGDG